ncbi:hypothetical protein [Roseovarius ramblicola]|uniref:Uncharacterized protein n=1 Tax=Roseovarius ramblicola TaxID=2022336 RepID=A0ABV5HYC1_9RHOB
MRYPDTSLDQPISELAKQAVPARVIAERIGVKPQKVHSVLHRLRRHGAEFPRIRPGRGRGPQEVRLTRLSAEVRAALEPYAAARGVTVKELAVAILDVVTRDGLVGAVLDDRKGQP